jgi:GT2 family glycosyltransferase
VLAFIDSDCIADRGWLDAAVTALHGAASGSIVAGMVTRSRVRNNAISLYDSVTFLQQEAYVKWSHAFVTANLVVPRSVFDRIGPFDQMFSEAAFEDWDWALRARRANIPIHYEPTAVVDHPCMAEFRQLKAKMERLSRGEILFRRKYGRMMRRPSLEKVIREHARRAWRHKRFSVVNRLRLVAVSVVAGLWRWQAFRTQLRAEALERSRRSGR